MAQPPGAVRERPAPRRGAERAGEDERHGRDVEAEAQRDEHAPRRGSERGQEVDGEDDCEDEGDIGHDPNLCARRHSAIRPAPHGARGLSAARRAEIPRPGVAQA